MNNDLTDVGTETGYAFGEINLKPLAVFPVLDGLAVSGGGRYDKNSRFGEIFNPHAGFAWTLGPMALKGSVGTAFRAPSLNDLYWPAGGGMAGNSGLKPERGRSAEAGIEAQAGGITTRAGLFWREIKDQIDWAPDADGVWRPSNTTKVVTRGVEAQAGYHWNWLALSANVTGLDAVQHTTESVQLDSATYLPVVTEERFRRAAFVPRVMAGGMARVTAPWGTTLALNGRYSGDRRMYKPDSMTSFPNVFYREKRLPPFSVFGLRFSHDVGGKAQIYAGVDNLMDMHYAEQFGNDMDDHNYPMPGRTWYAGVDARW